MNDTATQEPVVDDGGFTETPEPKVIDVDTSKPTIDGTDDVVLKDGTVVSREAFLAMKGQGDEIDPEKVTHLPVRQFAESRVPADVGLIPLQDELRGMAQLAMTLAMAGNVPKALRDKPADVLAVIVVGRELGVAPMTAIRTFHVIDGTVTVAPKVRAAMVRQRGLGRLWPHQAPKVVIMPEGDEGVELCRCGMDWPANDDETATWHAERSDDLGIIYTSTYTIAMARAVTFTSWENGNKVNKVLADKDNWRNYPARMLTWRSMGYLLDDAFPEVGTGLYAPDEMGAMTDENGQPILDVASSESLVPASGRARAGKAQPRGANATPTAANPAVVADLHERINVVAEHPGAREALLAIWDEKGLPILDRLQGRQEPVAKAAVALIEKRIKQGEFGEPSASDEASVPPDAPDSTESASEAVDVAEQPPPYRRPPGMAGLNVSGLPAERNTNTDLRWVGDAPDGWIEDAVSEVKPLDSDAVRAKCKELDLPVGGSDDKRRAALTARLVRLRMEEAAG